MHIRRCDHIAPLHWCWGSLTTEIHLRCLFRYDCTSGLQPTGSSGSTSGADSTSSSSKAVTTSSSAEPDRMAENLEQFNQLVNAIRLSAVGVVLSGAVSALADSGCTSCTLAMTAGGATLRVDLADATSKQSWNTSKVPSGMCYLRQPQPLCPSPIFIAPRGYLRCSQE